MLKEGSLFSGYGGLSLAVCAAFNARTVFVSDIDPGANLILAHRYPDAPNLGDITEIDWHTIDAQLGPIDILSGGFPCQDVSPAGRRAGLRHGTRSGLWHQFARAIAELRPRYVVIENVRGLLTARGDEPTAAHLAAENSAAAAARLLDWLDNRHAHATRLGDADAVHAITTRRFRVMGCRRRALARARRHERNLVRAIGTVLGTLADLGYDAEWHGLRAADVGAPHNRFRIFIVATDTRRGSVQRRADGRSVAGTEGPRDGEGAERERVRDAVGDASAPAADARDRTGHGERARPELVGGSAADTPGEPGGVGNRNDVPAGRGTVGCEPAAGRSVAADSERGGWDGRPGELGSGRRAEPPHCRDATTDTPGDGRNEGRAEPAGIVGRPDAAERRCWYCGEPTGVRTCDNCGADTAADAPVERRGTTGRDDGLRATRLVPINWGPYAPAIHRWEHALDRPAPAPTETGPQGGARLAPRFVEWMMGLPAGWVTDTPGLTRNDMLKALGNGVVPQQGYAAVAYMLALYHREDITA